MIKKYFVYCHIRQDTNEVFYIGKGSCRRINEKRGRSKHWQNIVNKAGGFVSRVIAKCEREVDALEFEKKIISKLKDQGVKLCNVTNGGEGVSGYKHTPEMKEYLRLKAFGNKSRTGQKASDAEKRNISLSLTGKKHSDQWRFNIGKAVKCITNGVTYPTQTEAAKALNLLSSGVSMCCRGKLNHTGGYQFQYTS